MPKTYGPGLNDRARDEMIQHFEESGKFNPNAYLDSENIPTIGWGFTRHPDGRPVRMGDTMTPEVGAAHYRKTISDHVKNLRGLQNYSNFNPNQQAALESFAYNVGPYFLDSPNFQTISRAIKAGDNEGIVKALQLYNNRGTPGLVRRRKAEGDLFNKPWKDPNLKIGPAKKVRKAHSNPVQLLKTLLQIK